MKKKIPLSLRATGILKSDFLDIDQITEFFRLIKNIFAM